MRQDSHLSKLWTIDIVLYSEEEESESVTGSIGVNISERKSGTERSKKGKKRELVCFAHRQGAQLV